MNAITIKSIAKINIGLIVKEKRSDGFHNLETIFYPLNDIADTLIFEKNTSGKFESNVNLPFDESNLIFKAKTELEKHTGKSLNVSVSLNKKIPMGGGLGGGSSNAAATLSALNKLFDLNISKEKLAEIALTLGSDVPYFLLSKPALGELRGEKLTPLNLKINGCIVLVNPGIHISTKKAFESVSPKPRGKLELVKILNAVRNSFENADKVIINDFEQFAFSEYPEIEEIKNRMRQAGAVFSAMTGTGSTVYGIFPDCAKIAEFQNYYSNKKYLILISENHG